MAKQVIHLSFSGSGGAGRVATQLAQSQKNLGWDASMVTLTDTNLRNQPLSLPLHTTTASIDNFFLREKTFPGLISLTRDSLGSRIQRQKSPILHLHWVNGVIDFSRKAKDWARQPIVWTMHDMNPFTGACHQSFGCEGYTTDCGACPAVKTFAKPLVTHHLESKISNLAGLEKLIVVAPNPWLAREARRSSALRNIRVEIIPNPVRSEFFMDDLGKEKANHQAYFTLVAADTTDPLKNVQFAVDAFRELRKIHPNAALLIVGKGSKRFEKEDGVYCFESMEPSELRRNLIGSLGILVPSLAENAPLVIAESAVLGIPSLVNQIPSLSSMVEWLGHGFAEESQQKWVRAMSAMVSHSKSAQAARLRGKLMGRAAELFNPTNVAQAYIALYEELL